MKAKIINASWGGYGYDLIQYNAIKSAKNSGVLFVAAAGNYGTNNDASPLYPASYDLDNIIAVAATDQDDNLANFSNYGSTSVDVAAPGVVQYQQSVLVRLLIYTTKILMMVRRRIGPIPHLLPHGE